MNTTLRNTIKTIDSKLLAGTLTKLNRQRWKYQSYLFSKSWLFYIIQKKHIKKMHSVFKYNNSVCFTGKKNHLDKLFDKYKSDKGSSTYKIYGTDDSEGNYYHEIYELLFFQHKNNTKLVVECGIGTKNPEIPSNMSWSRHSIPGGSLRAWRDYFPNAQVIGIDIDPYVMFTEDRISTYVCDQTSKQSINKFIKQSNLQPNTVDIIIDDGLHRFIPNITLFENTKHLLKDNGIYIIEDFFITKVNQQFIDYFNNIIDYNVQFTRIFHRLLIIITKNINH